MTGINMDTSEQVLSPVSSRGENHNGGFMDVSYDQTNIDFYQVVGVKEKSVYIRPIAERVSRHGGGGPAEYVVPVPNSFTGPRMLKRVGLNNVVRIASYAIASPWDGKEEYQTAGGWGH